LITRGTIEEKVYHRQIYKHFLTNKILKNPQQRRFFKARDMKDLFILNDNGESGSTETSNIFSQVSENVNVVGSQKDNQNNHKPPKVAAYHADGVAAENGNTSEIAPSRRKGKEKADHSGGDADEETHILRSLFDANGIHVSSINFLVYNCLYSVLV
jgi:DNA excision repair protein ERCC-6